MSTSPGRPQLSVVVPFYDVAEYIDEALASVAAQTFTDLEVVMVDDGSTDGSAAVAQKWCDRDPRFRLVQQDNHGLGHARNTGVRHARGDLLTFLDSDDVIPGYAYAVMVRTIEQTRSDFVSGNVWRFDSEGTWQSGLHKVGFRGNARRTHLSRRQDLMTDRLVPNKVFTREFWDEHELAFPEGVLYEDIPLTIPAHLKARAVDVISVPVYLWRTRENGSVSITQDRTHLRGLRDRFTAIGGVRAYLVERRDDRMLRWFDAVVLRSDIRIFLDALGESSDEFGERFLSLANDYLEQVDPSVIAALPASERLRYELVRRREVADIVAVTEFLRDGVERAAPVRVGDRYLADLPFRGDPARALPDDLYDVTDELRLRTRIASSRWARGRLRVDGWAYVTQLGAARPGDQQVRAWLSTVADDAEPDPVRIPLRVRPHASELARADSAHLYADTTGTGVRIDLPIRTLLLRTRRAPLDYRVELEVDAGGVTRSGRLGGRAMTRPERPGPRTFLRAAVEALFTQRGGFLLRVGIAPDRLEQAGVERRLGIPGDALVLAGRLGEGSTKERGRKKLLRLTRVDGTDAFDYVLDTERGRFSAVVPLDELRAAAALFSGLLGARPAADAADDAPVEWDVVLTARKLADHPVVAAGLSLPLDLGGGASLVATSSGGVRIRVRPPGPA